MGASLSNNNEAPDRPPVYVVPAQLDLTPRQLSVMIETGHQPGVPFPVVTQEAVVEQPPRLRTTFFHSQCHVHKDTVEISMAASEEALAVDFTFDTTSTAQLSMYLFSKEPSSDNPKFEDENLVFRMQCGPGMKQKFVGEEQPQSHIGWAEVERRHCSGEEPDISTVDLLLVLEPIAGVDDAPFKMVDAEVTSVRLVITELEDSFAISKIVTQKVKTSLGFYNVQELFGIDAENNVHTTPAENTEDDQSHIDTRADMCLHLIPVNPEGQNQKAEQTQHTLASTTRTAEADAACWITMHKRRAEEDSAGSRGEEGSEEALGMHTEHLESAFAEKLAEIEQQRQLIANGEHPELLHRNAALTRQREKRIAAADRFKKLQIKAIHELFEYEKQDAAAQYETAVDMLKDRLLDELDQQVAKLEAIKNAASEERGTRALRSKAKPEDKVTTMEKFPRRKRNGTTNQATLIKSLTDPEIRNDFDEIVRDLHFRASQFVTPDVGAVDIRVAENVLFIEGEMFRVGSDVSVHSSITNEEFIGTISLIVDTEVIVRVPTGSRVRIYLTQLRTGRVRLSMDTEASELSDIREQNKRARATVGVH